MTSIPARRVVLTSVFAISVVLPIASSARAEVPEQLIHEARETTAESSAGKPNAGLVQSSDGTFYGTSRGRQSVNGNVFKVSGTTYSTLLPFSGGEAVYAGLAWGPDGELYGTIYSSTAATSGTVFRISVTGNFEVLHTFNGADGAHPYGPVVVAADGSIYGTTAEGGAGIVSGKGFGTVFKLTLPDTLTTLYDFGVDDGATGGANPRSRIVLDAQGGCMAQPSPAASTAAERCFTSARKATSM